MKHIVNLILALALALLAGCGSSITNPEPKEQEVKIKLFGAGAWNAVALITESNMPRYVKKGKSDTTEFVLGKVQPGGEFTLRTSKGWYEFFKAPDSIQVVIGHDTTITYWPEGMETTYIVGGR